MDTLAIITNAIPDYRVPFFRRLKELGHERGIQIDIYCQAEIPGSGLKSHPQKVGATVVPFLSLKNERLSWQCLPLRRLAGYSALVFYGNPRVLSTLVAATAFRAVGKSVAVWGQARAFGSEGLSHRARLFWWRLFALQFVYSESERQYVGRHLAPGALCISLNNGLDQSNIDMVAGDWSPEALAAWRMQHVPGKRILLSCARLIERNKFGLMIQALPGIMESHKDVIWCVIGDGPQRKHLEACAESHGLGDYIRWMGPMYDEKELAPWFLSADLLVHTGPIGLTVLHAAGYGLPVVTHDNPVNHGPEFHDALPILREFLFEEDSAVSLAETVGRLLSSGPIRASAGSKLLRHVHKEHNVEVMAERFLEGIDWLRHQ